MNGIDNIAGYTLTTGTADFVITDSIAQYDPIIDNLADGDECNYKAQFIDPSFNDQYETGRGTWNATARTISRDTIKTSSNNGLKEDFGAGPKVVFIVNDDESIQSMGTKVETATAKVMTATERTNIAANMALLATRGDTFTLDVGAVAGTVAAGDDGRFGAVDYGDLPAAAALDGTEVAAIDQGGDGVQTTVQDISGNPVIAVRTFAMDRVQGYSNFNRVRYGYNNTTDSSPFDLEPYLVNLGGAAAVAGNSAGLFYKRPAASLGTGTDTTGYSSISHMEYPLAFDPAKEYDQTWDISHVALPTVGQASQTQVGFIVGAPALASQGMYFYLDAGSNNWFYAVKDAGGTTSADTTVAGTTGATTQALRVHYDPSGTPSTKFYVDGTLCATVLNSDRVVATNQELGMVVSIRKSAGTSANIAIAWNHKFSIQRSILANF